jgi:hypothetical protein
MPSLADWRVESLRVTVFTNELTVAGWSELWPSAAALEERREQSSVRSVTQVGTYERWQLSIQSQLDRVDLVIAAPTPTGPVTEIATAGAFDDLIGVAKTLIPATYGKKISRVAFGAVLLSPADSHELAYAKLGQYLPSVKVDSKSKDFFYQINRPLAPANGWPAVNRVSQWAAIKAAWIMNPTELNSKMFEMYASRLILDINTSQETSLDVGNALPGGLLDLLVAEGRKIASVGDL